MYIIQSFNSHFHSFGQTFGLKLFWWKFFDFVMMKIQITLRTSDWVDQHYKSHNFLVFISVPSLFFLFLAYWWITSQQITNCRFGCVGIQRVYFTRSLLNKSNQLIENSIFIYLFVFALRRSSLNHWTNIFINWGVIWTIRSADKLFQIQHVYTERINHLFVWCACCECVRTCVWQRDAWSIECVCMYA